MADLCDAIIDERTGDALKLLDNGVNMGIDPLRLFTDVIDYSELKNGIREDGSVYAMYSFARKLGQALAAGLSGWLLTGIGYSSEAAAAGLVQSAEVLSGIFNISTLIPAIGFAGLAAVLWFWYPLHKKQVDANIAQLKAKRGE